MKKVIVELAVLIVLAVVSSTASAQNKEYYFKEGFWYFDSGNYSEAIQCFDKALELCPECSGIYNNRGTTYLQLKEFQKAMADFNKAIETSVRHNYPEIQALAYSNRGLVHAELEEYQQAISDFTKSIELSPQDATSYLGRGFVYESLGDYEQADEDLKTAARLGHPVAQDYLDAEGIQW